MISQHRARFRRRGLGLLAVLLAGLVGFASVSANVLGIADRLERLTGRIEMFLDPPPDRETLPTVAVTPRPSASAATSPAPEGRQAPDDRRQRDFAEPSRPQAFPTPEPVREAVDRAIVEDHGAVFASQLTNEDCAVAATQMVLAVLGLGDTSDGLQVAIKARIGEWESWEDSHNGGWGPAAVSLALASYGAPGYEIRAYETHTDALRDSAIAIDEMKMPVVMFPWWGAHTWVMTGYRADADPAVFPDATISGAYILDPWYPRVSSIWGPSDGPGNFENLAELERNWPAYQGPSGYEQIGPGWTRPEGAYPDRDGKFIVLIPTEHPTSVEAGADS